jgi:hypothetical protein
MQVRAISCQLFFEGDIDSNGSTGPVVVRRVTGQLAELACSTWIVSALMEQPKTH